MCALIDGLHRWSLQSSIGATVRRLYHRSVDLNYRYRLFPATKSVGGVTFRTYEYLKKGDADRDLAYILSQLSPDDVFYDIGANVGHYLLPVKHRYPEATLYGFEPDPHNYWKLQQNLEANRVRNHVVTNNVALSDSCGTAPFYASTMRGQSSFHKICSTGGVGAVREVITVPAWTVDALVDTHDLLAPTWMKIDVEGHEVEVVDGAEATIQSSHPSLCIECHGQDKVEQLRSRLESWGYYCETYRQSYPRLKIFLFAQYDTRPDLSTV